MKLIPVCFIVSNGIITSFGLESSGCTICKIIFQGITSVVRDYSDVQRLFCQTSFYIYVSFTYLTTCIFPYFNSFHRDPSNKGWQVGETYINEEINEKWTNWCLIYIIPWPSIGTRSDEVAHLFWVGKYPLFDMGRALTSHCPSLSGKTAISD